MTIEMPRRPSSVPSSSREWPHPRGLWGVTVTFFAPAVGLDGVVLVMISASPGYSQNGSPPYNPLLERFLGETEARAGRIGSAPTSSAPRLMSRILFGASNAPSSSE